eukprot:CAMPEP_0196581022 /NCGR_PEP_ID=MMETSP1081-20130531/31994_1 /TAXON_ID=36882 /ORGANISM="Pyramimonas amylifera, Strain CCMP720" /LENGTH=220 /DNA_ID=CAMNT_0041901101 /DNA_START=60 /DNA_END=722 /DNA_ORIENTATION=-
MSTTKFQVADIRTTCFHHDVYEPAEDSYMLVDALESEWGNLKQNSPSVCLEIGCGTGYVICSAALLMKGEGTCLATDINPTAATTTSATLKAHNVHAEVVVGDLLAGMQERLQGKVDLLLFNPPYVPTPDEEVGGAGITASWAGGARGRVVIDRVLPLLPGILSERGVLLMVLVKENDVEDVSKALLSLNLDSTVVLTRRADEELLHILKVWKKPGYSTN